MRQTTVKHTTTRSTAKKPVANKGSMTVQEAGKKGGNMVKKKYGKEFYEAIGKKGGAIRANAEDIRSGKVGRLGGQKVKRLIEAGKKALGEK